MQKVFNKLFLFVSLTLFIASCARDEHSLPAGTATVNVIPKYQGKNIEDCVIYIKHNTSAPPADGSYTGMTKCVYMKEYGYNAGAFRDLMKGDYYLYAKGWSPDIQKTVEGGKPLSITKEKGVYYVIELDMNVAEPK